MHPIEFGDVVILALIEGVAGVLPLDESGHRALLAAIDGWKAGPILVALHFGTLLALLACLWRDILLIGQGLWKLRKKRVEPGTRLLVKALVAAAPWMIASTWLADLSLPLLAVGLITLLSAVLMWLIDAMSMTVKRVEHLSPTAASAIGVIQLLALLPGFGRLAMALTMTRLAGLERLAAFRFCLLASIPVLLASTLRNGVLYSFQGIGPGSVDFLAMMLSFILSLAGIGIVHMWTSRDGGLLPFALYRMMLGSFMIWSAFTL